MSFENFRNEVKYYTTLDGTKLAFFDFNSGNLNYTPIILMHGGLGNASEMIEIAAFISNYGVRIIIPEYRGHGSSCLGKKKLTYDLYCSDITDLLNTLKINEFCTAGFSDGAITALKLAALLPNRVKGVVSIAPDRNPTDMKNIQNLKLEFDSLKNDPVYFAEYLTCSPEPGKYEEYLDLVHHLWTSASHIENEELAKIKSKCLIVGSDSDEYIKTESFYQMAEQIGNCELKIYEGKLHGELTNLLMNLSANKTNFLVDFLIV